MPRFHFQATDADGQPQSGFLEVSDAAAVARQLAARGWRVATIELVGELVPPLAPVAEQITATPLNAAQQDQFGVHLAEIVGAELPLPECLQAIADEIGPGNVASALRRVADAVAAGQSLPQSLESSGAGLPDHLRGLILAGMKSGRLAAALAEFAQLKQRRVLMRQQLRGTLTYPAVLFGMLLGVALLFSWYVVPLQVAVFEEFKLPLSDMTHLFLWLLGPGIHGLLCVIGALAAILLVASFFAGRRPWHWVRKRLPIVGRVFHCHALSEFSQLLAALLAQGVPLPEALRLTAGGISDALAGPASARLAAAVELGRPLAVALRSGWPRPLAALAPIVQWGEQNNALPDALRAGATMYEDRADAQIEQAQLFIPPLVFFFVVIGGGMLAISLLLPLVTVIDFLTW